MRARPREPRARRERYRPPRERKPDAATLAKPDLDRPSWRERRQRRQEAAHGAGLARIDIAERDVDVPSSSRGEQQARRSGALVCRHAGSGERPEVVLTSPYRRAQKTAALIRDAGGLADDAPEPLRRRAAAGEGTRHPRPAHPCRRRAIAIPIRPRCGRAWASSTTGPVRRELVRRHPPSPKCPRHHLVAPWWTAGAGRRSSGRGALPALPAGDHDRGGDPRHRRRGRGRELLGDGVRASCRRRAPPASWRSSATTSSRRLHRAAPGDRRAGRERGGPMT